MVIPPVPAGGVPGGVPRGRLCELLPPPPLGAVLSGPSAPEGSIVALHLVGTHAREELGPEARLVFLLGKGLPGLDLGVVLACMLHARGSAIRVGDERIEKLIDDLSVFDRATAHLALQLIAGLLKHSK